VLSDDLDEPRYSHADVPYRIRPYQDILTNPRDTIVFDSAKDDHIEESVESLGQDARLYRGDENRVVHSSLMEKLLTIILAKTANFVPGGGIWMNTQRPEWNDANNALVGPGLSMVTLGYLRRMVVFLVDRLDGVRDMVCSIDRSLADHFDEVRGALGSDRPDSFHDPRERKALMDRLGESVSRFRDRVYSRDVFLAKVRRPVDQIVDFLELLRRHLDATLDVGLRDDGLYDSYSLLVVEGDEAQIRRLDVMLEGQVAVLSSGFLDFGSSLALLEKLERSALYREDQDSYILYPDKSLPDFLEMNRIPAASVDGSPLLSDLAAAGNTDIILRDPSGPYRFHPDFRNAEVLGNALDRLSSDPRWRDAATAHRQAVLDLYEEVFDHASFTGRSGTFFAYEGLGSIYWHMVSKLLLAVQETAVAALDNGDEAAGELVGRYFRIRSGLSFNKAPEVYGAFVTDPYSHTPKGSGARQPGMTGQVKEELITRWGELGVEIDEGRIGFWPRILSDSEYLDAPSTFEYVDSAGRWSAMDLGAGTLAFTICGVPVRYESGSDAGIAVRYRDGSEAAHQDIRLSAEDSCSVFRRDGRIAQIVVGTRAAGA